MTFIFCRNKIIKILSTLIIFPFTTIFHAVIVWLRTPLPLHQRFLPHHIGLVLKGGVVVDGHAVDAGGGSDAAGHLLGHVPGLVREVLLLAGGDVDVGPLRICKGLHGGGLAAVVMDPDIVQGESGKALDTGLQVVRQAGLIFPGPIRTIIHNADRPRIVSVLLNDPGILRLTTLFRFHIFYCF